MENDRMLTNNEDTIFNKFAFPLKSINELNALEEYLIDETNTNMFVSINKGLMMRIKLNYINDILMFLLINFFR